MAEKVGSLYYEITLDTREMIDGQRKVDRELKNTTNSLDAFGSRLTPIAAGIAVMAAALASVKIAKLADEFRLLGARIEVAAGSIESGSSAFSDLVKISRATQSSLAGNIEVFARLNQSILQMGGTQQDTLQLTELLAKAIKVSGASAVEAKSAMLQFGQALGSGKLAGDELRSLLENAPYLMRQLADGIGVPVGSLKMLGEQGKLTADVVTNALTKAAAQIDEDFKKFPQTIESAMVVAQDAAALAALKFDELTGSSAALTGVTKGLGDVMEKLADQLGAANSEAGNLGRNRAVKDWADSSRNALSYLVDAADVVWQTLSVLGRNVAFVFEGIGKEIGGIGAQVVAVLRGDFAGARAIGDAMVADSEARRKALDEADARTLSRAKTFGKQMREAWDQGAGGGRGSVNPMAAPSQLKAPKDDDAAKKAMAKRSAAQAYYLGLVADSQTALKKIDTEEQKALEENNKRRAADGSNAEIYQKARVEIHRKYARERALLEEKATQDAAELNIATTTDQVAKVEAVRTEAIRRAAAAEKLGTMTHIEAEQAKTLATFNATQQRAAIQERQIQANAEAQILLTKSTEQKIILIRDEAVRQAEAAYKRGQMTFEESETEKTKAMQKAIEDRKALEVNRTAVEVATLQIKASSGGSQDRENQIRASAAAEIAQVEQARLLDLEASQTYADQKVAIEAKMQRDIAELRANANTSALSSTENIFGSLASIMKAGAGEQSGIYQAMFEAQKAFSIAQSIVAIQAGIANAASLPFPANLGAMASVAAATASIVSTISGVNYGGARQYGGPASAGSMYRVNETGAPEMFTANNGNQYMLPTKSGSVTAADSIGGGGISVVVNVDASGSSVEGDGAQSKQLGAMIGNAVRAVLIQEKRNGGLLA